MMISPFGPIWANCLIPSPNLEPIPAAMIINVVFIRIFSPLQYKSSFFIKSEPIFQIFSYFLFNITIYFVD